MKYQKIAKGDKSEHKIGNSVISTDTIERIVIQMSSGQELELDTVFMGNESIPAMSNRIHPVTAKEISKTFHKQTPQTVSEINMKTLDTHNVSSEVHDMLMADTGFKGNEYRRLIGNPNQKDEGPEFSSEPIAPFSKDKKVVKEEPRPEPKNVPVTNEQKKENEKSKILSEEKDTATLQYEKELAIEESRHKAMMTAGMEVPESKLKKPEQVEHEPEQKNGIYRYSINCPNKGCKTTIPRAHEPLPGILVHCKECDNKFRIRKNTRVTTLETGESDDLDTLLDEL